jgi:hypothetical protein
VRVHDLHHGAVATDVERAAAEREPVTVFRAEHRGTLTPAADDWCWPSA